MEEVNDLPINTTDENSLKIPNANVGCKYVVIDNDVDKAWAEFISLYNRVKYPDYYP
jgi:hypothetical protein